MTKNISSQKNLERSTNPISAHFAVVSSNRSVLYAASWLSKTDASIVGAPSIKHAAELKKKPTAILVAGDTVSDREIKGIDMPVIFFWDFEVGQPGIGAFASAVSGVSSVIGKAESAPGILPVHMPEQWAGIFGASLALGLLFDQPNQEKVMPNRIDVSAADILRAFAEQNSGNHAGVPYGWRRNGLTAVEHGGVFPQGFFQCKDGYVAVQARSRQDWMAILSAFDNPKWSEAKTMQNPFKLSEDDSEVLPYFQSELDKRTMVELLDLALLNGAPMAPVLSTPEAVSSEIFRDGFVNGNGSLNLPFIIKRLQNDV